jgi:uncharacterized protein
MSGKFEKGFLTRLSATSPATLLWLLAKTQEKKIFRPYKTWEGNAVNPLKPLPAYGEAFTNATPVSITTEEGIKTECWYMEPKRDNLPVYIFLQGNTGHIGDCGPFVNEGGGIIQEAGLISRQYRLKIVEEMLKVGAGVLVTSYPGYSNNSGAPTQEGIIKSILASIHWLEQKSISSKRTILYGDSLGATLSFCVAARLIKGNRPPQQLVACAPFTNIENMILYSYPKLKGQDIRKKLRHPLDAQEAVRSTIRNLDIILAHGVKDRTTNIKHSRMLEEEAKKSGNVVTFMEFEESGHTDLPHSQIVAMSLKKYHENTKNIGDT